MIHLLSSQEILLSLNLYSFFSRKAHEKVEFAKQKTRDMKLPVGLAKPLGVRQMLNLNEANESEKGYEFEKCAQIFASLTPFSTVVKLIQIILNFIYLANFC